MQFDNEFLERVGLGAMAADRKADFLQSIQGELELRVGRKMSAGLTEGQLAEFDTLAQSKDTAAIQDWIRLNCPTYKDIAMDELRTLTEELIARRDEILAGVTV